MCRFCKNYKRNLKICLDFSTCFSFKHSMSSYVTICDLTFVFAKGSFNNYVDKKGGRGGQQKVHACPPRGGGSLDVHVDNNLKEKYRTIMANYYEKSYYFTFCSALT